MCCIIHNKNVVVLTKIYNMIKCNWKVVADVMSIGAIRDLATRLEEMGEI